MTGHEERARLGVRAASAEALARGVRLLVPLLCSPRLRHPPRRTVTAACDLPAGHSPSASPDRLRSATGTAGMLDPGRLARVLAVDVDWARLRPQSVSGASGWDLTGLV